MSTLLERVALSIEQRGLLRPRQKILVAVSGGVDSLALLHVLHELSRDHGWRLTVAHLNHQLRGRSSDADERLVRQVAKKLRAPIVRKRADVRAFARNHGLSLELAARKLRHDFLARTARRLKIPTVALAHHGDDQLELFFLRLLRGSGNEGLAGMKWKNASPSDAAVELVRPLLDEPKAALQEYASSQRIRFRDDASNLALDIPRNRIRHELLPLLRQNYQPALDRALRRVMDIAGAEAELVSYFAATWLVSKARAGFDKLPTAVQRRCVQLELLHQKIPAGYELVELLRAAPQRPVALNPTLSVWRDEAAGIHLVESKERHPNFPRRSAPKSASARVRLENRRRQIVFAGVQIQWRVESKRFSGRIKPVSGRECFDADKVGSRIVLRHWRPGDRFQPIGMSTAVKLQDLFTNRKIPRVERHRLIVATTAADEVFWVEKLRISERFKLSAETIRHLHWQWKRF